MTRHTSECREAQAEFEEFQAKFEADHPNYCRTCGGYGITEYRENVAPGGWGPPGDNSMTFQEACPDCLEKCLCPLCRHYHSSLEDDGELKCPCGFDETKEDRECMWEGPQYYGCFCDEHYTRGGVHIMASAPKYKVYVAGAYVAACKDIYDALAIVSQRGVDSAEVRAGHTAGGRVWLYGDDGDPCDPSWDCSAEIALNRHEALRRQWAAERA